MSKLLDELADKINEKHKRVGKGLRTSIKEAAIMGQWLLEAKRFVAHGEFEKWADGKLIVRESERRVYMQIAKEPERAAKCQTIRDFIRYGMEIKKAVHKEKTRQAIADAVAQLGKCEDNWQVHRIDNRLFNWPMVHHIFTDPPWEEIHHYQWLAAMAMEHLREGGLLAVQCGQKDLAKILPIFQDFQYLWTLAIVYAQGYPAAEYKFLPNWRPVLLFSRGQPKSLQGRPVSDTVTVRNNKLVKVYHPWQQPLEPFVKWIPALTNAGDLVADPFCCTGTIGVACKQTGRRFVGTEILPDMVAVARKRLAECEEGSQAE